jgi:hypothetical protein
MAVLFSYQFTLAVWLFVSACLLLCCCDPKPSVHVNSCLFVQLRVCACLFSCQLSYDDFFEILEPYTTYDIFFQKLRAYGCLSLFAAVLF